MASAVRIRRVRIVGSCCARFRAVASLSAAPKKNGFLSVGNDESIVLKIDLIIPVRCGYAPGDASLNRRVFNCSGDSPDAAGVKDPRHDVFRCEVRR